MNLDKNLRIYRERAGYATAKEFADALDVPYNTYTAYENQKREPKLEMLIKIADLLNVSLDDLLGRTPADEDERLKKEINDLLNPNELKNLRVVINNIDEKNIYCSFLELNYNFSFNKSHIVSTINALNKTMEDKKKNIFQKSLFSSYILNIIILTDRRIDDICFDKTNLSIDEKNKEIQKMLNIQNELSKFLGIDKQLLKLNNEYDMSKNK
ncbi:helix-turn-helix domain-containing protein [Megamonas sp.]|uniref:helix-turn-helix domain-containing protein n=1 Tax=Megamonas TaxID=158846 RepID=UPI00258268D5|nr:helix-turn-helix transcriptional regulator [Megamonas sp.]